MHMNIWPRTSVNSAIHPENSVIFIAQNHSVYMIENLVICMLYISAASPTKEYPIDLDSHVVSSTHLIHLYCQHFISHLFNTLFTLLSTLKPDSSNLDLCIFSCYQLSMSYCRVTLICRLLCLLCQCFMMLRHDFLALYSHIISLYIKVPMQLKMSAVFSHPDCAIKLNTIATAFCSFLSYDMQIYGHHFLNNILDVAAQSATFPNKTFHVGGG